jgi:hypothetical protein
MKREHEKILADLSRNLMDRTMTAIGDVNALCHTFKIPDGDACQAVTGILLFIIMDLMHHLVPTLSPKDFGRIAEGQFTKYLELEKEKESRL